MIEHVQNKLLMIEKKRKTFRFICFRVSWKSLKWTFDLMVHWILSILACHRSSCGLYHAGEWFLSFVKKWKEIPNFTFDSLVCFFWLTDGQPFSQYHTLWNRPKERHFVKLCIKSKKVHHLFVFIQLECCYWICFEPIKKKRKKNIYKRHLR